MSDRFPVNAASSLQSLPIPAGKKAEDYLLAYKGIAYSCVKAIAQDVASIQLKLYKRIYKREKVEYKEITEHEALSLLEHVNEYTTKYDFLFATEAFKQLQGEAFWLIFRDTKGRPVELWPLRPDWITIIPSTNNVIKGYELRIGGTAETVNIPAGDIIHHKDFNPIRASRGKGTVQAAALELDLDEFSGMYARNFFFNSATPSLLLKFKRKIDKPELDRFVADWESKFRGANQAHKLAVISGEVETEHLTEDMAKLNLTEQRRFIRDNILAIFQVPKSIIGLTEDVNKANAEATIRAYMERVVDPRMQSLVAILNEFYLKQWADEDLFFDYETPVPRDRDMDLKIYDSGLRLGWLSVNEVREMEKLEPVKGGDEIRLPQTQPNEQGGGDNGEDDSQEDGKKMVTLKTKRRKGLKFNIQVPMRRIKELRKEEIEKKLRPRVAKLLADTIRMNVEESKREAHWKKFVAKTDLWEVKIKEQIRKLFEEQYQIVEGKLHGKKRFLTKSTIEDLLFDLLTQNTQWKAEFEPILKDIIKEQGKDTLKYLGISNDIDITNKRVTKFLREKAGETISGINETTLNKLRETLAEGVDNGEGTDQLSTRVRQVFDLAVGYRAEMIARTEVIHASNFATLEGYKQSGVVVAKEWLTAFDERTCPVCEEMNGKQTKLGSNFDTEFGEEQYPPAHPSCRCTLIPVIIESERG